MTFQLEIENYPGVHERECQCERGSIEVPAHTADPDALEPTWVLAPCPRCKGAGETLDWRRPWWL